MRKIDPVRFRIATRGTSREINRRIVLNLVRTHQPISRADLARTMGVRRGTVSLIVNDLLKDGFVFEGAVGETVRGRRPTFLYIDSRRRAVVAVDIRASQTYLMLADLLGKPIAGVTGFPTPATPADVISTVATRVRALLEDQGVDACDGVGVVVPGMVEPQTMRVVFAPTLGWRDVDLRKPLADAIGLPVQIENSGRACALAQLWAMHGEVATAGDLVFVNVADGLGVGVVINGEMLRGHNNIAGELGHVPLSGDGPGPRCSCGASGCWEAYVSNRATMARYFGRPLDGNASLTDEQRYFRMQDLIARARSGDVKAIAAVQATGRYLGLGLASVVNAYDPSRVYIGGEITAAWDLIEQPVRAGLAERVLIPTAAALDLRTVGTTEYPRLQGAAALVAAPAFAAPVVA
jgi:predicted NBD/HSP70 family sugar kinase